MKIYAPDKNFNGTSAGVCFVGGTGETVSQFLADWFESHGYQIEKETRSKVKKTAKEGE